MPALRRFMLIGRSVMRGGVSMSERGFVEQKIRGATEVKYFQETLLLVLNKYP